MAIMETSYVNFPLILPDLFYRPEIEFTLFLNLKLG